VRYLDQFCAWTLLLVAVLFMLVTEIRHLRGAFLEDPFLWLLVAMVNFVRLRNYGQSVKGLKVTCVAANVVVLTMEIIRYGMEIIRYGMYGNALLKSWGPYTLIAGIAVLGETIFSVVPTKEPA
jgi:hypothetical protein